MTNDTILKANILGGLNSYILEKVDDEDILDMWWTYGVPNECDEQLLVEIAEDDAEFRRICGMAGDILSQLKEED